MSEAFDVIESVQGATASFEVLQYKPLQHDRYFYLQKSGARLKQVRINLQNGSAIVEAGALHFSKGQLQIENSTGGASGLIKKFASSMLTQEAAFKPSYTGTGEIYLEPSFNHFLLYQLNNEEIIVDKGLFYACESSVSVGVATQKNLSSTIRGGEGFFQTKLSGTGLCVLHSPVPSHEIFRFYLNNERMQVDGNFTILRNGNINFTVERSAKTMLGTLTSGEGYLQTFTGTGSVWVAPTASFYQPIGFTQALNNATK